MGRSIHRLTAVKVSSLRKSGYYSDGGGLYLRVKPSGSKSWVYRFMLAGRRRDAGLGRYPSVGLARAREKAEESRRLVVGGIDPIEQRAAQRETERLEAARAITFEECAKAYIESHEAGWRNPKHRQQWRNTLSAYVFPTMGSQSVSAIDTDMVLAVLSPIWTTKPETASRVRGRIEAILDWARVRGYRDGENPARWRGCLKHLLPAKSKVHTVEHHAALPYVEIGQLMAELREQTSDSAKALQFLVLTATRTGETLGARWDEIDLLTKLWVIPAERMKGGTTHRVPLSPRAIAIIKEMAEIRQSDFVFAGAKQGRPLSSMALAMLLRRMGHGDITVHGLRSSFRDWAAETTNFPNHVVEMALAHAVGDKVEAAYRRGDMFDKRKRLMDVWATFCGRRASANVVPLHRAK
ncbi:MAG: integrase arm-type DNA-binding domain-containing protein, partial [Hyphomicrobiaceae bacterium]